MRFLGFLFFLFLNFACYARDYQKPARSEIDQITNVENYSNAKDSPKSTKSEIDWITNAENYFNNELISVISEFTQVGSHGSISTGKIFLKRKKGLMKIYYDDPNPNIVIVKDYKLTHFDRDLKEKTVISVYSSPLAFFFEKKVDLKKNVKVVSQEESPNFVTLTLKKREDENEGAITLVFSKKPFQLQGWIILENNNYGRQTQIALKNAKFNAAFSDKEFDKFSLIDSGEK